MPHRANRKRKAVWDLHTQTAGGEQEQETQREGAWAEAFAGVQGITQAHFPQGVLLGEFKVSRRSSRESCCGCNVVTMA